MAADVLSRAGFGVDLFEAMPSPGRKFLMAGKGGLNITHAEDKALFLSRYGAHAADIAPLLEAFSPADLRAWMQGLNIDSFVGSSGRVFPAGMKAAPLLRACLQRLRGAGVRIHVRHRWVQLVQKPTLQAHSYELNFATETGEAQFNAQCVIFALGGASWAKLGSDGRWVEHFCNMGKNPILFSAFRPANCGFDVAWSEYLRTNFAGQALKNIAAFVDSTHQQRGELMISEYGIEGGLSYAFSAPLREQLDKTGSARLYVDLLPQHSSAQVLAGVAHPRGARSLSSHLRSQLGLKGLKMALLHECIKNEPQSSTRLTQTESLASLIKALPIMISATRPLDEAISSAGGVSFSALNEQLMLGSEYALPGVFCAGEMLDWEAPTGGYLLSACFASGFVAGHGAVRYLRMSQLPHQTRD